MRSAVMAPGPGTVKRRRTRKSPRIAIVHSETETMTIHIVLAGILGHPGCPGD